MKAANVFEPRVFQLRMLNEEHAEIRRRFTELEGTLLMRRGMTAVMEASGRLVRIILQHFFHEDEFLVGISNPILLQHRAANFKLTSQLCKIEDDLKQCELPAVFRLLYLTRNWMNEHMQVESVTLEPAGQTSPIPPRNVPA